MVIDSNRQETEVLVVGGGPGGYEAAVRAAQLGKVVTLVEMDELGGTCLQRGCIPSKALIHSAGIVHRIQEVAERGITVEGAVKVNAEQLQVWKKKVIGRLTQGIGFLMKSNQVTVVKGRARFTGPREVQVEDPQGGSRVVAFQHCIIATGSVTAELPFLKFDHERVLTAGDALALKEIPRHLVVVGGGYIGLELGICYRKLGAEVTVVEAAEQVLPGTDPDLIQVLMRKLRKLGITVHLQAKARGVGATGLQVTLGDGQEAVLDGDRILVSVGRKPYTEGLGLAAAGVQTDVKGFIPVTDECRTNVPHIFAVGDVAGGVLLAHKASHQGKIAAEVIAGKKSACDWVAVPAVVFTDPEIAYVGLSEAAARAAGHEVAVAKFPYTASGRAMTMGETDGVVKLVANKQTGVVLGVHMVGPEVSELVAAATLALEMAATVEDVARTIHPHPTLSEGIMEAAQQIFFGLKGH